MLGVRDACQFSGSVIAWLQTQSTSQIITLEMSCKMSNRFGLGLTFLRDILLMISTCPAASNRQETHQNRRETCAFQGCSAASIHLCSSGLNMLVYVRVHEACIRMEFGGRVPTSRLTSFCTYIRVEYET